MKLNKYFKKLNKTPIYYIVVILHPYTKLFYENAWKDRLNWLKINNTNFQALWAEYKALPNKALGEALDEPILLAIKPPQKRLRLYTARDSYVKANTSTAKGQASDNNKYKT